MYEDGLDKVMPDRLQIAPTAPEADITQVPGAQHAKVSHRFEAENGMLFKRMLLCTADCRERKDKIAT